MKYSIKLSTRAKAAIDDGVYYIGTERQAPENAERWLEKVWAAIESLEVFPNGFPLAPENEFLPYEIRMRIIGSDVLLFTVDQPTKTVHVIGFRHGARLPRPEDLPGSLDEIE